MIDLYISFRCWHDEENSSPLAVCFNDRLGLGLRIEVLPLSRLDLRDQDAWKAVLSQMGLIKLRLFNELPLETFLESLSHAPTVS